MIISLYIHKMLYKFGGTESFTAKFLEIIQNIYPNADIALITECFKKGDELSIQQFIERMNKAYGTSASQKRFLLRYIYVKEQKLNKAGLKKLYSRLQRKIRAISFQRKLLKYTKFDDLFVNCSNQSVIACAKRNITIIHFPQNRTEDTGIYRKLALLRPIARKNDKKYFNCYEYFLPNSQFTAGWLKEKWNIPDEKIKVFYHPVAPVLVNAEKKANQIFICGRIEASKKIDVMINAFNSSAILKENCVMKIAGSCDNEDTSYVDFIRSLCTNNIEIILSPNRTELEKLYAESGIFWHAKGYGETNPMLMEHFGMTTVEAMSAGCIPVVINKGGQPEIVNSECGYVWDEPIQLVSYTEQLLMLTTDRILMMREACRERSKMCSKESFKESVMGIL